MNSDEGRKWIEEKLGNLMKEKNPMKGSDDKKICIIIDGEWGIGKTYCVRGLLNEKGNKLPPAIENSLFGKNITIEKFERKLKLQIILKGLLESNAVQKVKFSNEKTGIKGEFCKKKLFEAGKSAGIFISELLKKHGVDLNTYIDNVSIEDLPAPKDLVVVIDDIERKSDAIRFNDILGMTEELTKKFIVILILNSEKLKDEDKNAYQLFREKVVDYDLKIDEVTKKYLYSMLGTNFSENEKYYFLQEFLCNNASVKNIRIAEKLCKLIIDTQNDLQSIYNDKNYQISYEYVREAYNVLNNYYLGKNEKKTNKVIYDYVEKIFKEDRKKIERLRKSILENYPAKGEVEEDCIRIIDGYELCEEDFYKLVDKMKEKITKHDKEYFTMQSEVLMACEAFGRIGLDDDNRNDLLEIAKELYSFSDMYFDSDIDYGSLSPYFWGKDAQILTLEICNEINEYNRKTAIEEVKVKMDDLLNRDEFTEYFDYVDSYDMVFRTDGKYALNHIINLYTKELKCHHGEYYDGLCLIMPAVRESFAKYLLQRASHADTRELTLILKLQKRMNRGKGIAEETFNDIEELIDGIGNVS